MRYYYAELYIINDRKWNSNTKKLEKVQPYLYNACGPDSIMNLDGRLSIENMVEKCVEYINKDNKFWSFVIYKSNSGRLNDGKQVYSNLPIDSARLNSTTKDTQKFTKGLK